VAGCFERGNKSSRSIKGDGFIERPLATEEGLWSMELVAVGSSSIETVCFRLAILAFLDGANATG
jgi:hypothetical protein